MKYFITSIALITSLVINFGYINTVFARGIEDSIIGINSNQGDDQNEQEDQEDIEDDSSHDESDDDSDDIESEVAEVMNQTSQESQSDLKDQINQVKTTTEEKKSLRDGKSSEVSRNSPVPTVPASKDPRIVSVVTTDDHVEMDYKQPVKLFGLIPVQLLVHSSVDATGRVKVKFPWIARLAKTNRDAVEAAVAAENAKLDTLGEMSEEQQLKLQLSMDQKSKFAEILSNIMKKMSETSDSITENLK